MISRLSGECKSMQKLKKKKWANFSVAASGVQHANIVYRKPFFNYHRDMYRSKTSEHTHFSDSFLVAWVGGGAAPERSISSNVFNLTLAKNIPQTFPIRICTTGPYFILLFKTSIMFTNTYQNKAALPVSKQVRLTAMR